MEEYIKMFENNDIVELANKLRGLKDLKEAQEADLKDTNMAIEAITKVLLPQKMDEQGIQNVKIDGVGRVSLRGEVYASILAENRELAYDWLRNTGRAALITNTVNPSTLKACAKEWLKNGEEIPEFIKITPATVATLTRT